MAGKIVTLEITDLAFDGKSVAHLDGKVVFLKGGLPGEKVEAEITVTKPRYNTGIVTKLLTKSEHRIKAKCSHFGICGGCTWQDLKYEIQLMYKQKQVYDCLARIGNLSETEIDEIIPSEEIFNYRNKMEYSFHTSGDNSFTLGLHQRGHFDKIFDLKKCHLQAEPSSKIVNWMRDYVAKEEIPVYDVLEHTGYMRFLMIRTAAGTEELMINMVTNYGDFPDPEKFIEQILPDFPEITTIVHNQNGKKSNIATGEIEKILHGPGFITEKLLGRSFRISSNSFFQTNPKQTETLYRTAFEMLGPDSNDRVLDLYCGTGSIGILLADRVKEVVGVEIVPDAIVAARKNAEINGIENIQFYEANVKDYLNAGSQEIENFNILIIDPPRAGINPRALKKMLKLKPEKILYISCNPATFSRDAANIVESGYTLPRVKPVDMFPHTMHIELVSVFYREK